MRDDVPVVLRTDVAVPTRDEVELLVPRAEVELLPLGRRVAELADALLLRLVPATDVVPRDAVPRDELEP